MKLLNNSRYNQMIMALANEKAIDKNDYDRLYKKEDSNFIPIRPITSINKIKNKILLKNFHFVLTFFWIVIFPLFMTLKFFKYLFLIKTNKEIELIDEKVVIATSHRIQDLFNVIKDENKPKQWLIVPWIKINNIDFKGKYKKINAMSYINLYDLIIVYIHTIYGLMKFIKTISYPTDILQSYVLFEYFLLEIILNKLNRNGANEYWYSNHYDRWSVLIDSYPKNKNVLIQHGALSANFILPYKLKNIKKLFLLNKRSLKDFQKCILDKKSKYTYEILKNTLKLSNIDNYSNSILVIGSPSRIEYDISLSLELIKNKKLFLFIKPHPGFDNRKYLSVLDKYSNCEVIKDKKFYPKVQVVISDYSTLAYEYEECGINIIWRPELKQSEILIHEFILNIKDAGE